MGWQLASPAGTQLQARVHVMRQVDQLLGRVVARPMLVTTVMAQLTGLVGGLPGDDPTEF